MINFFQLGKVLRPFAPQLEFYLALEFSSLPTAAQLTRWKRPPENMALVESSHVCLMAVSNLFVARSQVRTYPQKQVTNYDTERPFGSQNASSISA